MVRHYIGFRSKEFWVLRWHYCGQQDTHAVYNLVHTSVSFIDCPAQILMGDKCGEEIVFLVLSGQLIRFAPNTDIGKQ